MWWETCWLSRRVLMLDRINKAIKRMKKLGEKEIKLEVVESAADEAKVESVEKRRRLSQEEICAQKSEVQKAQKLLREQQASEGLTKPPRQTTPNKQSQEKTIEEEIAVAVDVTVAQVNFLRKQLPVILNTLRKIEDPRQGKKIKHKLSTLMLYGIIAFVHQISSRRELNRKLSNPSISSILQSFFPELESIPHQDTLNRVLSKLGENIDKIELALASLIKRWMRKKKFTRFLIDNYFDIAFDGTQKTTRNNSINDKWSERTINGGTDKEKKQYFVYVLEANLVFHNGFRIPLMSEFLEYDPTDESNLGKSEENIKQDCELKAFKRLAHRLKKYFSHVKIRALLDGLYANGPLMKLCSQLKWGFMIVLKDKSLPRVWKEFDHLAKLKPGDSMDKKWKGRDQHFTWVNDIEYDYIIETKDGKKRKQSLLVNVVVCDETWKEVDKGTAKLITKKSKHAWLSSKKLSHRNTHERCNLSARNRWNIEISNLIEKHHGYNYEHLFSNDWDAMRGFHYLMRLAHALNELARYTKSIAKYIKELGQRAFIDYVFSNYRLLSCLNYTEILEKALSTPSQIRLL